MARSPYNYLQHSRLTPNDFTLALKTKTKNYLLDKSAWPKAFCATMKHIRETVIPHSRTQHHKLGFAATQFQRSPMQEKIVAKIDWDPLATTKPH